MPYSQSQEHLLDKSRRLKDVLERLLYSDDARIDDACSEISSIYSDLLSLLQTSSREVGHLLTAAEVIDRFKQDLRGALVLPKESLVRYLLTIASKLEHLLNLSKEDRGQIRGLMYFTPHLIFDDKYVPKGIVFPISDPPALSNRVLLTNYASYDVVMKPALIVWATFLLSLTSKERFSSVPTLFEAFLGSPKSENILNKCLDGMSCERKVLPTIASLRNNISRLLSSYTQLSILANLMSKDPLAISMGNTYPIDRDGQDISFVSMPCLHLLSRGHFKIGCTIGLEYEAADNAVVSTGIDSAFLSLDLLHSLPVSVSSHLTIISSKTTSSDSAVKYLLPNLQVSPFYSNKTLEEDSCTEVQDLLFRMTSTLQKITYRT